MEAAETGASAPAPTLALHAVEALLGGAVVRFRAAGWKSVSLVDVRGRPSFTLWLCGCVLRCPFCHNWRVAEDLEPPCHWVSLGRLVEELEGAKRLVDYVHVTGGEPLVQWTAVERVFEESKSLGLATSINTCGALPRQLERLVRKGLVDHAALDLKAPPELLTGLDPEGAEGYWRKLMESLELLSAAEVEVELRVPVVRGARVLAERLGKALAEAAARLNGTRWYVVVNPLLGPPRLEVRCAEWCAEWCNPAREDVEAVADLARKVSSRVYVMRWLGV